MRILFVSGSCPPETCGIADYTAKLGESIAARGVEVTILSGPVQPGDSRFGISVVHLDSGWRLWKSRSIQRTVQRLRPDLVHLQYPGLGYGYSLSPHALAVLVRASGFPLIVTLHEFAQAHVLRRLSTLALMAAADQIVLTTEAEQRRAARLLGWFIPKLTTAQVAPIGSSLPDFPMRADYDPLVFAFWGMFHPGKGLESLLEALALAVEAVPAIRLRLVGGVRDQDRPYLVGLRRQAQLLGIASRIEFALDRSSREVAALLRRSCAVVLPFVDGATYRRSTLIAALRLGVPVITSSGVDTPAELQTGRNVILANGSRALADGMLLLAREPDLRSMIVRESAAVAAPFEWGAIAQRHIALYERMLHSVGRQ